jgi:hypothetical protein
MRTRVLGRAFLVAAFVLALTGCGDEAEEAEEGARQTATSVSGALEGATRLTANLTGTAEVPGPGDPDGTGRAMVNLDVSKREVCYDVAVQRIDRPTGMHIHEAAAGRSGEIVVPMNTPTASDTTTTGCVNVDAGLIGRMAATPANFYVNVHTDTHPQGAVRGQLSQ